MALTRTHSFNIDTHVEHVRAATLTIIATLAGYGRIMNIPINSITTHINVIFSDELLKMFDPLPKVTLKGSRCDIQGDHPSSKVHKLIFSNGDTTIGSWKYDPDINDVVLDTNQDVRIDSTEGYTYVGKVKLLERTGLYEDGCIYVPHGAGVLLDKNKQEFIYCQSWDQGKYDFARVIPNNRQKPHRFQSGVLPIVRRTILYGSKTHYSE